MMLLILLTALTWSSPAQSLAPVQRNSRGFGCALFTSRPTSPQSSTIAFAGASSSSETSSLKQELLRKIDLLKSIKTLEGQDLSIDFGVKGGELNETTRAPQKVDFYSISDSAGQTAQEILNLCDRLAEYNPTPKPTAFLGDKKNGEKSPLHGPWKLLFSTAADASFSKNSTRGDALISNVVDACKGRMANIIEFLPKGEGKQPLLQQLKVIIDAKAVNDRRVALQFKYAKVSFSRFFFFPLKWSLFIPVPGPFITRLLVLFGRILRFGRKGTKVEKPPEAYFDVLYLDDELRVHKTGEDNIFVQGRPTWGAAQGLFAGNQ